MHTFTCSRTEQKYSADLSFIPYSVIRFPYRDTSNDNKIDRVFPSVNLSQVKLIPSRRRRLSTEPILSATRQPYDIPAHLDWREFGFTTPPVNQESCGSCYAYSIAESIQGQIFKQTGMLIPLSAQQLVDCSTAIGNRGCAGGSLRNTLRYLEKSKGLMAESQYPYTAEVRSPFAPVEHSTRYSSVVE